VYDPYITICRYKVLLQEYVMLCYGFPSQGPTCSAKVFPTKTSFAPCGSQVTTWRYKVLLQEYVTLCYGFPSQDPACSAKVFPTKASFAPCGSQVKYCTILHSLEQYTQHIVFPISKQTVPYWTRGSTCCPGVSTLKIWSLADPSNHIT
jgi:hypothetical protein